MEQKVKEPFFRAFRRELHAIKDYYLRPEQAENLQKRSWPARFFISTFYILKAFYSKLSPVRRVLFLFALFFLFSIHSGYEKGHFSVNINLTFWSGVILILLLLLELKDKMLIRDEILAAKAIQNMLIPHNQPHVSGFDLFLYYQPMHEVGGDLVDVIALPKGTYLLALADISGKGLPAALLMSRLQSLIHAFAYDTSFEHLMETINQKFVHSVPRQSFASMLLLKVKEDKEAIYVLNAGHLPPLLWQKEKLSRLPKGGLALGLRDGEQYGVHELHLEQGDVLICYSDGLSEAFDGHGEWFGEQRIEQLVQEHAGQSAREIAEALLQGLQIFMSDKTLDDDLTLIVLKKD